MKKNKFLMALLSFAIAFGLWLYVINYVSLDSEDSFYNIPVNFTGESMLQERGLMITDGRGATVSLRLSGKRSDLMDLDSSNITIEADLSTLDKGNRVEVAYNIRYPGGIPNSAIKVLNQEPGVITLNIEEFDEKFVNVVPDYGDTTQPEGYLAMLEEAVLSEKQVKITGPVSILDQITSAVINVDLTNRTKSFTEEYAYTLCNEDGEPVDLKELVKVDDDGMVRLDLTILRHKEVPLWIEIIDGGGATSENSTITIDPEVIQIAGNEQVLEKIDRIELIGQINLGEIEEETTLTFAIAVPENVENITNLTEATVTVSFPNLMTKVFNAKSFVAVNVPSGMEADILTKDLPVTLRGPASLVRKMTDEDVTVVVDFANAAMGTTTVRGVVRLSSEYAAVGQMGTLSVTATLREPVGEETTP